jgi:hypothetical protein
MSQPNFPRWRQRFIIALFLAFLIMGALSPTRPAHAQESPLPTPTSVQVPSQLASATPDEAPTSPLPTPTPEDAGQASQPISATAATTAAPSSLAGTALTSPGAIAVIVLAALVAISGVVRYRQRS